MCNTQSCSSTPVTPGGSDSGSGSNPSSPPDFDSFAIVVIDNSDCAWKDAEGFEFSGESGSCAYDRGLGGSVRVTCHSLTEWSLSVHSDRLCSAGAMVVSDSGASGKCKAGNIGGTSGGVLVRCGATPDQAAMQLQVDAVSIQDKIDADKKKKKIAAIGTND